MTILTLLIPLSIALGLGALVAFFWALRRGQFNDVQGDSMRILMDDEAPLPQNDNQ